MSDQSLENMLWSSSYSCQAEGNSFKFPPGFRFHPTDEELVHHYLKKKVECKRMEIDIIHEIDLYKLEPWDLQDKCKIKGICSEEEENGCYFFCQKGRKYPTGSRTNRATCSGFWKATGRDKPIYNSNHDLIMGMRKTLVFYKGRAPHGHKSDWIMHEYRLQNCSLEEGWVVCKVFRKSCPLTQKSERESSTGSCQYNGIYPHIGMLAGQTLNPTPQIMRYPMLSCHSKHTIPIEMPHLESPKNSSNTYASLGLNMPPRSSTIKGIKGIFLGMETQFGNFEKVKNQTTLLPHIIDPCHHQHHASLETMQPNVIDWRVLDRLVASQLSPDDTDSPIDTNIIHNYGNVIDHNDDIYDNNGGGGGDDDGDDGRGNIINELSSAKSSG